MHSRPLVALFAFACLVRVDAALTIRPDHADGCYNAGETVTWRLEGGEVGAAVPYRVQADGQKEISAGTVAFTNGAAAVTASLDRPGTLLLTVTTPDKKKIRGGAAVDWARIPVSKPEPKDFDAFWDAKKKELAETPAAPELTEIDSGTPSVRLWKITLGGFRGSRIHGYLARPKGDAPAPAMLQVQYAGIYALQKDWVLGPAKDGWLALNIQAHDLPVDEKGAFYDEQGKGPLKDYTQQGADDRERSYFLRMYLSCVRAADYLVARPDWNQKALMVQGGSQGGMQGLALAGLHPRVTGVTVSVPAGCDQTGASAGRAIGFPWWTGSAQKLETSTYFDPVNFARRIRCPVLVGMGLLDTISPPTGVFAMFNQIPGPKRLVILPLEEHQGAQKEFYSARWQWWNAAAKGQPVPMK